MVNCLSDSSHLCLLSSLLALGTGLSAPMDWLLRGDGTRQEVLQHSSFCPQPGVSPGDGNASTLQDWHSKHDLQKWFSMQQQQIDAGAMFPFPPCHVCKHFWSLPSTRSLPTEGWLCSAHPTGEGSSMTDRSETNKHRPRTRQRTTSGEENGVSIPSSICGGQHMGHELRTG